MQGVRFRIFSFPHFEGLVLSALLREKSASCSGLGFTLISAFILQSLAIKSKRYHRMYGIAASVGLPKQKAMEVIAERIGVLESV